MAIEVYRDPGLLWLEDEVEPDPEDAEVLTVVNGTVWWSALASTDDDDDFDHQGWCPVGGHPCRCDVLI